MLEKTNHTIFETLQLFYKNCGLSFNDLCFSDESKEYDACTFTLDSKKIIHRTAKITPTKNGQFVTVWKRNSDGITEPFNTKDDFDAYIITVKFEDKLGQFIFPKELLAKNKIITHNGSDGKRGIRVYPPWDITSSKQAEKTQTWQLNYFIQFKPHLVDTETKLINLINYDYAK